MKFTLLICFSLFLMPGLVFADSIERYYELSRNEASVNLQAKTLEAATNKLKDFKDGSVPIQCLLSQVIQAGAEKPPTVLDDWNQKKKRLQSHCVWRLNAIQALISRGAVPTEQAKTEKVEAGIFSGGFSCNRENDLTKIITEGCPEVIDLVLQKSDTSEVKLALESRTDLFKAIDKDQITKRNLEISKSVLTSLQKKCEVSEDSCELHNKYKAALSLSEQNIQETQNAIHLAEKKHQQDEQRKQNSPEAILKKACGSYSAIQIADEQIEFQHAVGKESGYINKATLHEMGTMKVVNKMELNKLKKEYRAKTGKEPPLSTCPKRN